MIMIVIAKIQLKLYFMIMIPKTSHVLHETCTYVTGDKLAGCDGEVPI